MARRLPVVVALNKIDRTRRPPGRGPRRRLRAVHGPRRRRAPDRVPGRLHERQGRDGHDRPGRSGRGPPAAARPADRGHPAADLRARPPAAAARHQPVGQRLRRADGRRTLWNGRIRVGQRISVVREEADDTAGTRRARPDRDPERHGHQPADRPRHRAGRHRGGRPGRHRQRRRPARGDHRRHADRARRPATAAAPGRRRADPAHDLRRQHLAPGRSGREVRHQPPDQGPPREGGPRQRLDRGPPGRVEPRRSRSAAAASSSWPCSSSRCAARASS